MTKRYKKELENIDRAYSSALKADIDQLSRVVETWIRRPMAMIGSGGSFSSASFAAYLHELFTGQLSRAATPLEVVTAGSNMSGLVCFTASGRNRDIASAFKVAALSERLPLSAVVMSENTPLHKLARQYRYSDVVSVVSSDFNDGFLAVSSLIATSVLLIRAYQLATNNPDPLPESVDELINSTTSLKSLESLGDSAQVLTERTYVSVLHSCALRPAVIDLESRFVEASLGALHAADLRNFGHGRHFWFAKHSNDTGLVALVGDNQQKLADRTLKRVPETTEILRVDFSGTRQLQALAGLLVGLHISEGAGRSAGIDPGKPGVPKFGRDLYRLGPNLPRKSQTVLNQNAAIQRKQVSAGGILNLEDQDWTRAYEKVFERITGARFSGIVLDYDGTLCDLRRRYDPVEKTVGHEIERLIAEGAKIGIATGRGPSAGVALRAGISKDYWTKITIGYYNGAFITDLSDETDPIVAPLCDHPFINALTNDSLFAGKTIRSNEKQISITLETPSMARHAGAVAETIAASSGKEVRVVTSSHSIDILLDDQSKLDVVTAIRTESPEVGCDVLRIGDKGLWPGNDAELLDNAFGLTVDEASPHFDNCWGLAPSGVKGLQAAMYYLQSLHWIREGGRLLLSRGDTCGDE